MLRSTLCERTGKNKRAAAFFVLQRSCTFFCCMFFYFQVVKLPRKRLSVCPNNTRDRNGVFLVSSFLHSDSLVNSKQVSYFLFFSSTYSIATFENCLLANVST